MFFYDLFFIILAGKQEFDVQSYECDIMYWDGCVRPRCVTSVNIVNM